MFPISWFLLSPKDSYIPVFRGLNLEYTTQFKRRFENVVRYYVVVGSSTNIYWSKLHLLIFFPIVPIKEIVFALYSGDSWPYVMCQLSST